MPRIIEEAITFDDILLVPDYSEIMPKDVSLKTQLTKNLSLNLPLVSAAMDTVTESDMAIALAQEGGIGIIHKSMSVEEQAKNVTAVKKYESGVVKDPICIDKNAPIRDLLTIKLEHNISGVPVLDKGELVGIVTSRDVRFETNLDAPVHSVMTKKEGLVTVLEGTASEEVLKLMHAHRIEKILVVDKDFRLSGLITVKDIDKSERFPMAAKDDQGRLLAGASIGTSGETEERVEALVAAGVDVLVVDSAHGHSANVLNRIRWIKKNYPDIQVIGGNIATADAALALVQAGADAVKVGIGPGSICTTRIVAGVGVPQVTAIANVAKALKKSGIPVIADGGIRYSGDIAKAVVAGAHCVMVGSVLAGTEESPGELEIYQGRTYKSYRGMGSIGAMAQTQGSSDRYFQDGNGAEKLVPEGIEGRVPYKGPVSAVIQQAMGGLCSAMAYTGSGDVETMRTKPSFVKITSAGINESHVHDISITKEAPNYPSR
jgi:IMP dehydrogenase